MTKNLLQDSNSNDFNNTFKEIKKVIDSSRNKIYKAINYAMVETYWHVGQIIVEEEQRGSEKAEYGKGLIKALSKRLTQEYGKGYTTSNLW